MPKLFLINGGKGSSESEGLTIIDMDWSDTVDRIQDREINRIKLLMESWIKNISSEIDRTDNVDRIRFLEKVQSSINNYLNQNKNIDNGIYYLLIYCLESDNECYSTLNEDNIITLHCDDSVKIRTTVFMINQFNKNLITDTSIETFLSSIL